ncbi:hypothetical protein [uncultured Prevotella sp.]|uniref:hypothetical protein n=1 Tax=uncultured Prevotella sp. TaxID=159272 RepID=UPI0026299D09|nr:hypothetical protein [uncultured Prevotella sp.]
MKKRFFSSMFFAACLCASMSMFVSCKDYDDDINNLQEQITTNASTLDEMVKEKINNLTIEIEALKAQDATLETALANARTEFEQAVADAKSYADIQAAAAQAAAIEASKKNIEDACALLQASIDAANAELDALSSKVSTQEETINGLLNADKELQSAIDIANGEIQSAKDMAIAAQQKADENADILAGVIENLATVKGELDAQISALGEKIDGALEQIAANKAEADAQLAEVNALIKSNAEAITALQNKDEAILKLVTENSQKLADMAESLAALDAKLTEGLNTAKAYTDAQVAALKAELGVDIDKVKGDLIDAVTRIAAAEEKMDEIDAEIEKLKTDFSAELKDLSETVDASVAAINTEIAKINEVIDTIQTTVTENSTNIKSLQDKAAELEQKLDDVTLTAKEAQESIKALLADFEKYKTDNENNINEKIANLGSELRTELQNEVNTLNSAISSLEAKDADLQEQIEALKTQLGAITGDGGTVALIDEKIAAINERIDNLVANEIANMANDINYLDQDIDNIYMELSRNSEIIAQIINRFSLESRQLKSLVFSPQEYYQGIEAIGVWSFNYYAITGGLATPDLDKDQTGDYATKRASSETSVVPVVTASYYMNPSNAEIDMDKAKYNFIVSNANYTRAASASDITVDSVKKDNKITGLLNVYFSMKNANSIANINNGKVDVAALRYNGNDTIVTSDFAALKQYAIKEFYINKSATGNAAEDESSENHLAYSAADAVKHNAAGEYEWPVLEIAYNNTEGINLDKWINVHYMFADNKKETFWGDQAEINKKKFKLVYELIGYIANDADKTNESKHATIKGSILKVHGIDGAEASRKIIGRTPLVRVKLVDENTNSQVAEVGYIVVKITDVTTDPVIVPEADIKDVTNGYTVLCDDAAALNNVTAITWDEVENHVLGTLDMSKEEFEKNYTLELNWNTQNAAQYSYDANKNKFTVIAADDQIGTIVNTKDGTAGYETNVLKWTVGNNQAYQLFVENGKTSVTVWVRFKPNNTVHGQKDVYVPLTWTPEVVNASPVATINDTDKKAADWHAANSREAGFEELHIQVGNATDPAATCEYQSMIVENTFLNKPLDIIATDLARTYGPLVMNASVSYEFAPKSKQAITEYVGESGTKYTITVSNTLDEILADGVTLATINSSNGEITLAATNVAKDIINNYGYYEDTPLAKALTFTVVVKAATCAPADLITLENNMFNVKVIKPMFIEGSEIADMQLNDYSTLANVPVTLNFLDFNGYDPKTFWEKSNQQKEFWKFYDVKSIKLAGNIQTNYSGYWADVDTNDFEVTFTEPSGAIKLGNMGKVTLTQKNMSRANSFKVRIPLAVTYKWGVLHETVELNVNAASGNAVKRR